MKKTPKNISLSYLENLVREQELKEKKIKKIESFIILCP